MRTQSRAATRPSRDAAFVLILGWMLVSVTPLTAGAAAQSDDCVSATPIGEGSFFGTTQGATNDGSSSCGEASTSPDVWYAFTAPVDSTVQLDTCDSAFDTVLSVHASCPVAPSSEIACNDNGCDRQSRLLFRATAGATYWIRVAGWRDSTGSFILRLSLQPLPGPGAPDLLAADVYGLQQFGRSGSVVGCAAHSVVCNVGTAPLDWFGNPDPRHPVFAFNLYRHEGGRFEQIGQSWAKHGIAPGAADNCGLGCQRLDNSHLGVGCSDIYSADLNSMQAGFGPRHEINPWTGGFSFQGSHLESGHTTHDPVEHRLQLRDSDLDPTIHPNARFVCELVVVAHDDRNHLNNVVWRPVQVSGAPGGVWTFTFPPDPPRTGPAVESWSEGVRTVVPRNPVDDGRFVVSASASDNGNGTWRYEYAVFNLDAHRALGSFTIPVGAGTNVTRIDFRAVESAGEGFSNLPWTATRTADSITWATTPFAVDPRSNPLRWGTLYNFRFDADAPPSETLGRLGLFRPGTPDFLVAATQGPRVNVCRSGTVSAGLGAASDVLFINGAGDREPRAVRVRRGDPIVLALNSPPAGPTAARYLVWAWTGPPAARLELQGRGETLGCTVLPTPLTPALAPQPFCCFRGSVPRGACGAATEVVNAAPRTPWARSRPGGHPFTATFTLQGVIEDAGAANVRGFSVTNAVVLIVE